jgi:hypothetical protein
MFAGVPAVMVGLSAKISALGISWQVTATATARHPGLRCTSVKTSSTLAARIALVVLGHQREATLPFGAALPVETAPRRPLTNPTYRQLRESSLAHEANFTTTSFPKSRPCSTGSSLVPSMTLRSRLNKLFLAKTCGPSYSIADWGCDDLAGMPSRSRTAISVPKPDRGSIGAPTAAAYPVVSVHDCDPTVTRTSLPR